MIDSQYLTKDFPHKVVLFRNIAQHFIGYQNGMLLLHMTGHLVNKVGPIQIGEYLCLGFIVVRHSKAQWKGPNALSVDVVQ